LFEKEKKFQITMVFVEKSLEDITLPREPCESLGLHSRTDRHKGRKPLHSGQCTKSTVVGTLVKEGKSLFKFK
jgi:hypothetical protein